MSDLRRDRIESLRRDIERDNKNFDRAFKVGIGLWVVGALASLAFTAACIWGIVMLVLHFTG